LAGATANELSSPLRRYSRDGRAATHHIGVVVNNFEIAGRVLFGLEPARLASDLAHHSPMTTGLDFLPFADFCALSTMWMYGRVPTR
jgi:hypothetical protein